MNNKTMKILVYVVAATLFMLLCNVAFAGTDPRYCGVENVKRDAAGKIVRNKREIAKFRALWACPSTKSYVGACPDWSIDHPVPVSEGGCDAVFNMQWLPNAIKSCSLKTGVPCKDRWELDVYKHE